MPPAPEVPHGPGSIGMLEVPGQAEAQHPAQPQSHPGIAAEVQIQLQGIGCDAHPCQRRGHALVADIAHLTPQAADLVGQQHLHGQTQHEVPQSAVEILQTGPGRGGQLLLQGQRVHQRAGQQLGKQQHAGEKQQGLRLRRHPAPVHVDEIRRQLEGIEADGQGQRHSQTQEPRIFEEEQAAEQGRQAQHQQPPAFPGLHPPAQEIYQRRQTQQRSQAPGPFPHADDVEHQTPQTQQRRPPAGGDQIKRRQKQRQKRENKCKRIKSHDGFPLFIFAGPQPRLNSQSIL